MKTKQISLSTLLNCMCNKPRDILNIVNHLHVGDDADLSFFQLEQTFTVSSKYIQSKSKNTPFLNEILYGPCIMCVVDGKIIHDRVTR